MSLAILSLLAGAGWDPQLEEMKRDNEARNLAADPFFRIRKLNPEFRNLDFFAEAELIRAKKSRYSANDRNFILRCVSRINARKET